jgi:hypothetical protein
VHALEGRISELEESLAEPGLYRDPERREESVALEKELAQVREELEEAMDVWMQAEEART